MIFRDTLLEMSVGGPLAGEKAKHIVPYLKDPQNRQRKRVFSTELFQRLILSRVLELGWTCERFNEFDETSARPAGSLTRQNAWARSINGLLTTNSTLGLATTLDWQRAEGQSWMKRNWKGAHGRTVSAILTLLRCRKIRPMMDGL